MSKLISSKFPSPIKRTLKGVTNMLKSLDPDQKHWLCGGQRSLAVAIKLLQDHEIIAVPTDTIYGLAVDANDTIAIENLYRIKQRDKNKPLAICLSSIKDIPTYGVVDHLPKGIFKDFLPGKVTMILKRTRAVNPYLNPGIDNVGIRVPQTDFLLGIANVVGPLALTSANISNQPSSIKPEEFSDLWPHLGGIFHPLQNTSYENILDIQRVGSSVVDLTVPGQFTIKRKGLGHLYLKSCLSKYGLIECYE